MNEKEATKVELAGGKNKQQTPVNEVDKSNYIDTKRTPKSERTKELERV